jgi:hypothetical protein
MRKYRIVRREGFAAPGKSAPATPRKIAGHIKIC